MKRNRNLWIFIGAVILIASLISGFILMQPSAEDILVRTLETTKTIPGGQAVISFNVDNLEREISGKARIWAERGENGNESEKGLGAFRIEILEVTDPKAQGAVLVSDGETLWGYFPSENKVYIGTPENAQIMMEDNEFWAGKFYDHYEGRAGKPVEGEGQEDGDHDMGNLELPENAEEAVAKLLEHFKVSKSGSENLAGEAADRLTLEPIPEQMPKEYIAVGGFVNLWIGQQSNLPLAVSYTGGSLGKFSANVLDFEIIEDLDDSHFTFEIPTGTEIITIDDLEPRSLTLAQAGESAKFNVLTPKETIEGTTLVDILEIRGVIVQRFTLPQGGSFTISQGNIGGNLNDSHSPDGGIKFVDVRGTTGNYLESEDGTQVVLTWTEGNLFYSIAGDLTLEEALRIAESLQ
jgi:outer membrane lipoprotein-sorting protein